MQLLRGQMKKPDHTIDEIVEMIRPYFYNHWFINYEKNSKKPFGDAPHHTGFFFYALSKLAINHDLNEFFLIGLNTLYKKDTGAILRNPEESRLCNRDQLTPLLAAWAIIGDNLGIPENNYEFLKRRLAAKWILDQSDFLENEWMFPDDKMWFRGFVRFLNFWDHIVGDFFTTGNIIFNIIKEKILPWFYSGRDLEYKNNRLDSSLIKMFQKLDYYKDWDPTLWMRFNEWLAFKFWSDPNFYFRRYFTFKHHQLDEPPPIHLIWEHVFYAWR